MPSLRVCTITFDWYPFEVRALRLVQAAVDAGHEVDVICLRQPHEKRYEVLHGVRVYRMPMSRGFGLSLPITVFCWLWFIILAGITATRLHLKHRYDVIHVHNMPDLLVFSALLPRLLGAKVILDVQDVSPELMLVKAKKGQRALVTLLATWQERVSTTFADHVVTVGWPFEKKLLQRGVPAKKLTVILNSPDPKIFPPSRRQPPSFSSEERPFIIMYHGTVAQRNRLDTAIRAFAMARRVVPQLRFDIHGRGEQLPAIKQLARDLGVSDYVVFSDPCPPDKLVDVVVHGDLGIIPYGCDGFMELVLPTKAYEFAWMLRPIVASDTEAIRSMFRPESIVLCDANKAEEFAEAIIDLYQHPEKRERMITHAAEDYVPYRWEAMKERYLELLTMLASKNAFESRSLGEDGSQPGEHTTAGRKGDEGLAAAEGPLMVAIQPISPRDSGTGTPHHPSTEQRIKA